MKRIRTRAVARLLLLALALLAGAMAAGHLGGLFGGLLGLDGRSWTAAAVFGAALAWGLQEWRLGRLRRRRRALERALAQETARLERDMTLAAQVHNSIIPPSTAAPPFRLHVRYLPLERIGGDMVSYHLDPRRRLARIAVGDVTGHGLPAALLVNRIHHEVEDLLRQDLLPEDVLRRVNALVMKTFRGTEMMMTFACVEVALAGSGGAGRLVWANAAHPPPLHWHAATGAVTALSPQTTLLGMGDELPIEPRSDSEPIAPGDRLVLHTDGLIDALDPSGRRFGLDRLVALVAELGRHDPDLIGAELVQRIQQHVHGPAQDDVLVVTLALDKT